MRDSSSLSVGDGPARMENEGRFCRMRRQKAPETLGTVLKNTERFIKTSGQPYGEGKVLQN